MTDFKVTFPKLKSYSQSSPTDFSGKSKTLNTIATDRPRGTNHCLSLQERLTNLKYKYVNKYTALYCRSPNYFKQRELSPASHRFIYPNQTIEHYLAEQGKMFDKEALLDLARSRAKKNSQLRQRSHKRGEEGKGKDALEETRYSNFRPMKMPIKHNIKGIRHPSFLLNIHLA